MRSTEAIAVTSKRPRSSIWRKAFGWACLALGLLGLILPIIPGIPFLVIAMMALATQYGWARAVVDWGRKRFRRIAARHRQQA